MRQRRLKSSDSLNTACYHCVSRVVDRRKILGDVERDYFVGLLKEYARFCGVHVITYCIMLNHFHILVEVPAPEKEFTDEELLQRLEKLSGMTQAGIIRLQLETFRKEGKNEEAEKLRHVLLDRMYDVSAFMKILKQRFTQWYNRRKGRSGGMWEERFKSVLVERGGEAMAIMAAYIDTNPIRAKMVSDPRDYRWSGYGAANNGDAEAQEGLRTAMMGLGSENMDVATILTQYRHVLLGTKEQPAGQVESSSQVLSRDEALARIVAKEKLPVNDYLKCRVRYFCDGLVLGSQEFVEEVFKSSRERFGKKRKSGARRLAGLQPEIYSMRQLQKEVFE